MSRSTIYEKIYKKNNYEEKVVFDNHIWADEYEYLDNIVNASDVT